MTYENGINNGTLLRDFCLDGGGGSPAFREIEVLVDIELDWKEFKPKGGFSIRDLFIKENLLEIYKKRNYDAYVTGIQSAFATKEYKDDYINLLKDQGLKWKKIYKTEICDVNLV